MTKKINKWFLSYWNGEHSFARTIAVWWGGYLVFGIMYWCLIYMIPDIDALPFPLSATLIYPMTCYTFLLYPFLIAPLGAVFGWRNQHNSTYPRIALASCTLYSLYALCVFVIGIGIGWYAILVL